MLRHQLPLLICLVAILSVVSAAPSHDLEVRSAKLDLLETVPGAIVAICGAALLVIAKLTTITLVAALLYVWGGLALIWGATLVGYSLFNGPDHQNQPRGLLPNINFVDEATKYIDNIVAGGEAMKAEALAKGLEAINEDSLEGGYLGPQHKDAPAEFNQVIAMIEAQMVGEMPSSPGDMLAYDYHLEDLRPHVAGWIHKQAHRNWV